MSYLVAMLGHVVVLGPGVAALLFWINSPKRGANREAECEAMRWATERASDVRLIFLSRRSLALLLAEAYLAGALQTMKELKQ